MPGPRAALVADRRAAAPAGRVPAAVPAGRLLGAAARRPAAAARLRERRHERGIRWYDGREWRHHHGIRRRDRRQRRHDRGLRRRHLRERWHDRGLRWCDRGERRPRGRWRRWRFRGCGRCGRLWRRGAGGVGGAAGQSGTGVVAAGVRWVGRVDLTRRSAPAVLVVGDRLRGQLLRHVALDPDQQQRRLHLQAGRRRNRRRGVHHPRRPADRQRRLSGLGAGTHTVELYRQTEGSQGDSQLMGITVGGGALATPPAAPARLIEVIGDSISCGYGTLGTLSDSDCFPTESAWDTYEAVAARALGADVSTIAMSGQGAYRNYGGDMTNTLPMVYTRALTNDASPAWDFRTQAQAVIVNLGTNDISNGKGDPGTPFETAYTGLLASVRAQVSGRAHRLHHRAAAERQRSHDHRGAHPELRQRPRGRRRSQRRALRPDRRADVRQGRLPVPPRSRREPDHGGPDRDRAARAPRLVRRRRRPGQVIRRREAREPRPSRRRSERHLRPDGSPARAGVGRWSTCDRSRGWRAKVCSRPALEPACQSAVETWRTAVDDRLGDRRDSPPAPRWLVARERRPATVSVCPGRPQEPRC